MKRLILLGACMFLLGFAALAISQPTTQNPNNYPGHGMMNRGMMRGGMMGYGMMGPGMRGGYMGRGMMMHGYMMPGSPGFQNYQTFLKEARPIIEELNAKRAELGALYQMRNPDPKRVGKLAREITRLEEKLQNIAFKYNLPDPCPYMWRGNGMMMRGNWW